MASFKKFCKDHKIKLCSVSGFGDALKSTMEVLSPETKKFIKIKTIGKQKIDWVKGYLSTFKGRPRLHVHAGICEAENKPLHGRLKSAVVENDFLAVIEPIEDDDVIIKIKEEK